MAQTYFNDWYVNNVTNTTTTSNLVTYGNNQRYWVSSDSAVWLGEPRVAVMPELAPLPKTDLDWLRERVDEICWVPG